MNLDFQVGVRIAQMSDMHFSAGNLEESDRTFGAAVDAAIASQVHAAVITGDSTDHAINGHSPALIALEKHLQRLANHCPVLMLQGTFSHEPQGLLQLFKLVGSKFPIEIAEKIGSFGLLDDRFELVREDAQYKAVVHALPTLNKADIAALSTSTIGQAAIDAGNIIAQVLSSWSVVNRSLRMRNIPSMVISHGTVVNCMTEHGVPMAGQDHEFGVGALFSAAADTVALGHIHKHQAWTSDLLGFPQTIAYAGSIGRFHHGESGDKYWLEWNLVAGNCTFEAHATPSRRTVDIFFDGPPDMDEIRRIAEECKGAYVRVRYEVDEENRQSVDRDAIKAALSETAGVQIEGKTLIIERSRAKGISTVTSVEEKLVKWGAATETQVEPLLSRLALLQNEDAESLAKNITSKLNGNGFVVQNNVTATCGINET